jgi:hypothetical protein
LTLELFELNESAVEGGFEGDWVSAHAGVFHGDIEETSNMESRINGFFVDANLHTPENALEGLSLLAGVSYLSNVADSDTLQGQVQDLNGDGILNDLDEKVSGLAAYLSAEYLAFCFSAEYITTLDHFLSGEMAYAMNRNGVPRATKPAAWNFEFAWRPVACVQVGVKYEGTGEAYGLFPERQYGGVVSWEPLRHTTLSAEYLRGRYDEDNQDANGNVQKDRDLFTVQMAIEFP